MGQALYRKYRSRSFDEVAGQDHIVKTLQAAIKSGKISHAYLFTGPRGVGKTSVARILAHEINGLPYSGEETHLDIIEIDAASNRRIDEIRDLRDKVHITPTSAKYKVYIIDEVHMLTREAFNALLKTLEEPPQHVIFILATTESHKLPDTIVSRTQRYNFKAMSAEVTYTQLASIAKKEKMKADEPALRLLAEFGDGSMRDSISLLDQLGSGGQHVTEAVVREQLGLPEDKMITALLKATDEGRSKDILNLVDKLRAEASDPVNVAKLLAKSLRQAASNDQDYSVDLLRDLLEVSSSSKPFDTLEIALLEAASQIESDNPVQPQPEVVEEIVTETEEPEPEEVAEAEPQPQRQKAVTKAGNFDLSMWDDVLTVVKRQAPSLYTALRLAVPTLDGTSLTLAFEFALHQKKLDQAKQKDVVAAAIEEISGAKLLITCIVDKTQARSNSSESASLYTADKPDEQLETINNIFGSAEVLES